MGRDQRADSEGEHQAGLLPEGREELPGLVQLRGPPAPSALVIGEVDLREAAPSLTRLGYTRSDVPLSTANEVIASATSGDIALLGVEALQQEAEHSIVSALRSALPSVEVLLLAGAKDLESSLLLHALRSGVADVLDPGDTIALNAALERYIHRAETNAERVLAIGAHPDDVEIGCAGTLLEHRRRGDQLTVLTLSRGSIGGDQRARMRESTSAAGLMGARLLLGDLPDTRIDPGVETIRMIEAVVQRLDPSIVYVHSLHDNHQDHRAVHTAALSATRGVPQIYAYQSPSATNDFSPARFIPIDSAVARKIEVLGAFASQHERSYLEPDLVVAGARYWARHLAPRARYAEPFEVLRSFAAAGTTTRISSRRNQVLAPIVPIPVTPTPISTGE